MKKFFTDLNDEELIEFVQSSENKKFMEGTQYFIKQTLEGKLFFDLRKIRHFVDNLGKATEVIKNEIVSLYVTQYNEFISSISHAYPNLYKDELKFARQNIFNSITMAHPMEFVKKCVLFYGESSGSGLMERIGILGMEINKFVPQLENSEISESEALTLLRNAGKFLKTGKGSTPDDIQDFIQKQENYRSKEDFIKIMGKIKDLNELKNYTLNKTKENPTEVITNFLTGIQDTQSHIEYFCRFFHRLVHIKKYGNQDYGEEYYRRYRKKFEDDEFRDMCRDELEAYPELQRYLRKTCNTFKDLRNIRAHQVAGNSKFLNKDYIYIPNVNQEGGKCIDHKEKRNKIITYGVFINKIQLYTCLLYTSPSPRDRS